MIRWSGYNLTRSKWPHLILFATLWYRLESYIFWLTKLQHKATIIHTIQISTNLSCWRKFTCTKVGQQDYFECVCGGYLPEDMDDKWVLYISGSGMRRSVREPRANSEKQSLFLVFFRVVSGDRLWPATRSQYVGRVQYYNRLHCTAVTLDVWTRPFNRLIVAVS